MSMESEAHHMQATADSRGQAERPARPFRHLLLDIEGTTCPVDFVSGTLFPYAKRQLQQFLGEQRGDPRVRGLMAELQQAWQQDDNAEARALSSRREPKAPHTEMDIVTLIPYLHHLIDRDRKLTPLKQLQGMIWDQGYGRGELLAPLFDDVPPALQRWHRQGLHLSVYSSGSVQAQRLLYRHTTAGNLEPLFAYWFDTRTGSKQDPSSYDKIAAAMGCCSREILFISDIPAELEAASGSGMAVLFSDRQGNPVRDARGFPSISSFEALEPLKTSAESHS